MTGTLKRLYEPPLDSSPMASMAAMSSSDSSTILKFEMMLRARDKLVRDRLVERRTREIERRTATR